MISVIRMDNSFIELLKEKREIRINNIIFCYKKEEILGCSFVIYVGEKTNQGILSIWSAEDSPFDKDTVHYILFQLDNNKTAIYLSEANWKMLEPHLFSYGIVDAEKSIKYSTIFYTSE